MQATTAPTQPTPAAAPQAPAAQLPLTGSLTLPTRGGVPLTARDVAQLRATRSELSDQLMSATGRRNDLTRQLRRADVANAAGLQQRLAVLDGRIVQLESDIAETGRQIAAAPADLLEGTTSMSPQNPGGLSPGQLTGVSIVFTIAVLFPIAIALARRIWRGATVGPARPSRESMASAQRLERVEQAVDSIAIEIERVAEGQRFVTKLFAESREPLGLNAGQRAAEPIRVPNQDALRVPRES